MTTILLAILIGAAFGAVLDRIGATDPNRIVGMLTLTDMHLARTILTGIGVASVLMFAGQMLGLVDVGNMSVKTAYLGVILGGMMLGAGWAVSGYCPGTGVAALGAGRLDAVAFVAGGLTGAALYMASWGWVKTTGALEPIFGGKATLGAVSGADYPALFPSLPGEIVGIVMGLVLIAVAAALPDRLRGAPRAATA